MEIPVKDVRCEWFAATLGADNLPFVPTIIKLGGHVRVGLEDHQYAREGQLSNPQIVERAAAMIRKNGDEVASVKQTREMLHV